MRLKALLLLGAAVLAGCVTPPKEDPHPRKLLNDDVGLKGAVVEPAAESWWDSFRDPQLDRLIRQGLKDSPTLAEAQARVGDALAQAQSAQAALLPNANLDASALYQRAPENYLMPPPLAGHSFWMGQAGASLGWDARLLGTPGGRRDRARRSHRVRSLGCGQCPPHARGRHHSGLRRALSRIRAGRYRAALGGAAPEHRQHHAPPRRPPGSTRSSNSAKPKGSCRRRGSRAPRRGGGRSCSPRARDA